MPYRPRPGGAGKRSRPGCQRRAGPDAAAWPGSSSVSCRRRRGVEPGDVRAAMRDLAESWTSTSPRRWQRQAAAAVGA
jgi:hypothetical protein